MVQEVIQYLPTENIECDAQIREQFPEQELIGLARSMQEVGLQQPIRVRRDCDRLVVVDGERRLRAARLIKMREIAAIIEEKELCPGEILQLQIISHVQKSDLSPYARAKGIKQLIEATGWTAAEAAGKVGQSASSVAKLLALTSLPDSIREKLTAGQISQSSAYELSRVDDPAKQAELAQQVAERRLTRDQLSLSVKAQHNGDAEKTPVPSSRVTAALAGGQSVTVTAAGLTLERFIEVIEAVLAKARKSRGHGLGLREFVRMLRNESKAAIAAASEKEVAHVAVS